MHIAWKTTITIAVAALLSAPATAEWYAYGSFEPDTQYDQGSMFVDPPNATDARVYFTAMPTSQYGATTNGDPAINPNVALLRTQIEPVGVERHVAHLGVWMDCNGDGYIGMAEGALREYSADLLLDTTVCPAVDGAPLAQWPTGAYNYNGWVSEFIPISRGDSSMTDRRVYRDDDARVWGDFHRPDEKPFHRSCTLWPQARGTYHNTGGLINWVDCRADVIGAANDAFATIGDPLGYRFADEDDARTGALGQHDIGGDESDEHALVRTADCDAAPLVDFHSGDAANETPLGPSVPAAAQNESFTRPSPSVSTGDPSDFTLAGQLNRTTEEWRSDCDTSNDFGHDLYTGTCWIVVPCVGETDFNGVNPKNKLEADWNFGFTTVSRGTAPWNTVQPLGYHGPAGVAADVGIGVGSRWISDSTWASKTGPRSVRVDLENGGAAIAPAYWLTFYANVGTNTTSRFALPPGGGVYGSWHCGDETSGIHNGWNCDSSIWYRNPDGTFPSDPNGILAKVGWSYRLRDVDCFDGRIGDAGVAVEPAYYGAEPCITPS